MHRPHGSRPAPLFTPASSNGVGLHESNDAISTPTIEHTSNNMPTTRARDRSEATASQAQEPFSFPSDSHLLITTPRHVFAWDTGGVHTIFSSRRGSIIAAREAKDGSGVLAVASSNVVVMHDTKRGQEQSWGLDPQREEVRHLEYAPDAKSLFLSTTSDGAVQRYSTVTSRMLGEMQKHDAAPVALAVSCTGHLVLSASHQPPVIFLKNMEHNSSPIQLQPNASKAPVSCAVFHPERPNIFLLAFRDGTVAAYDSTRISRNERQSASDGEISCLRNVHRAVVTGAESSRQPTLAAPVVGAAFLPGFKTRAVTAGRDGKCKIIDFARGGVMVRTWHAKAPLTSVSVLALKPPLEKQDAPTAATRKRASASHTIGGPTSTDCMIAVSRIDGQVHIYDSVGILRAQKTVCAQEMRISNVDWAKGPAPRSLGDATANRHFSEDTSINLTPKKTSTRQCSRRSVSAKRKASIVNSSPKIGLGLPPELRRTSNASPRQFTFHPNEIDADDGTVRYTPSPKRTQAVPLAGAEYHDLFSPVKPMEPLKSPTEQRVTSPPRNRPRLSSQTFVRSPELESNGRAPVSESRGGVGFPAAERTSTRAMKERPHPARAPTLKPTHQVIVQKSPLNKTKRHITFKHGGDGTTRSSVTTGNSNARILADLRKLAAEGPSNRKHGTLSSYAVTQPRLSSSHGEGANAQSGPPKAAQTFEAMPLPAKPDTGNIGDANEDIWLTSSTDSAPQNVSRARRTQPARVAKQSPRSVEKKAHNQRTRASCQVDGSTEEEMFATAASRMSPENGAFSPTSREVRDLFPRTSSLSPRQRKSPKRSPQRRKPLKEATLTSMAVNGAFGRRPKSPWARAKAEKGTKPIQVLEDPPPVIPGSLQRSDGFACLSCPETKARVHALEGEVAHLKGEVLALKAILRRNGLPFQAGFR